jgi:Putative transposase
VGTHAVDHVGQPGFGLDAVEACLALERVEAGGVATDEFIRRFMLHLLPKGFHHIRHCGLLARSCSNAATLERARALIAASALVPPTKLQQANTGTVVSEKPVHPCPCYGAQMVIIERFDAGAVPRHRPAASKVAIRIDTS